MYYIFISICICLVMKNQQHMRYFNKKPIFSYLHMVIRIITPWWNYKWWRDVKCHYGRYDINGDRVSFFQVFMHFLNEYEGRTASFIAFIVHHVAEKLCWTHHKTSYSSHTHLIRAIFVYNFHLESPLKNCIKGKHKR